MPERTVVIRHNRKFLNALLARLEQRQFIKNEELREPAEEHVKLNDPDAVVQSEVDTFMARLDGRNIRFIHRLKTVLARFGKKGKADKYGNCAACGEPIAVGRLRARPMAILCIECKESQELIEKRYGHGHHRGEGWIGAMIEPLPDDDLDEHGTHADGEDGEGE